LSTKLHYGMIYTGKRGMTGLFEDLVEIRKEYAENTIKYMMQFIPAFEWFDLKEAFYYGTHINMEKGHPFDASCSVTFHPVKDGNKEVILVYPFGVALKLLPKHKNFAEFGYWDNTDPGYIDTSEDGSGPMCTRKEWNRRERLWGKLDKYGSAFNEMGFVFEMDEDSMLTRMAFDAYERYYADNPGQGAKDVKKHLDKATQIGKEQKEKGYKDWFFQRKIECWERDCKHKHQCYFNSMNWHNLYKDDGVFMPRMKAKCEERPGKVKKERGLNVTCTSYRAEPKKAKG